ncbi:MAG: hypothetical protein AVDCRST_MAG72-1764, partial [uncultured Nocardioidaceae bacterium]
EQAGREAQCESRYAARDRAAKHAAGYQAPPPLRAERSRSL